MLLRAIYRAAFLGTVVAMLFGCGGGGSNGSESQRPTYRLVNASPDTPSLDFFVNDDKKGDALPYGGSTPNFAQVKAELYDFSIHPGGAAEDAWTQAYDLQTSQDSAIVAFGLQSFGDEFFKRLRLTRVAVNRSQPNGTRARLIIVNGFNRKTGFDNVPVDFKNPGDNPQYDVTDIAVGGSSLLELDAGTQTFEMRLSGAEQVFVTKDLALGAGKIYLVLLTGIEDATGDQAPDIKLVEMQPKS